jgi:nucleoside-diphosphate-sugar epimerase
MNILILGYSGFIARNLIPVLNADGYDVYVFNRENSTIQNLNNGKSTDFKIFLLELDSELYVINFLAAWGDISNEEIRQANYSKPEFIRKQILEYSSKATWIQISSYFQFFHMLYGIDKNFYSECKRLFSESFGDIESSKLRSIELFLPHIYGSGDKKSRIIPMLLEAKSNDTLKLSSGNQILPLLNVADCALAIKDIFSDVPYLPNQSQFYIEEFEQLTLKQTVDLVLQEKKQKPKVIFGENMERKNEFYSQILSPIPRYKYKPKYDLESYVKDATVGNKEEI